VSDFTARVISAGEEVSIPGAINVGEHVGQKAESVSLLLTSGAVHVASLRCAVFATYTVSPESADLGSVDLDQPPDEAATVAEFVFRSDSAKLVGQPTADVPWLAPAAQANPEYTAVFARLVPQFLPWGANTGIITGHTNDPTRPVFRLSVRVSATASVRPIPAVAVVRRGEPLKVRFVDRSGRTARILGFAAGSDGLSASQDGNFLSLTVARDFGANSAVVSVSTDAGDTRVLVLQSE
jgi:hypothetical protein